MSDVQKDYGYGNPHDMVPGWITSFSELDNYEYTSELQQQYIELMCDFIQLAENILRNASYTPSSFGYDSFYVVDLLNNLNSEFSKKLNELQAPKILKKEKVSSLSKGDIIYWAFLDKEGKVTDNGVGEISSIKVSGKHGDFVASEEDPAYQVTVLNKTAKDKVYTRSKTKVWKRAGQIKKVEDAIIKKENVMLQKDSEGNLNWFGIVSNNFQDVDGDIFKEVAHIDFVERLINKEIEYPELWIWHLPKAVGTTEFVQYENNFLIAGGTVFKEYEELVTNLVNNTPDMRMSHGVPTVDVKYDKEGFIEKYASKEFTLLPGNFASNKLTFYGVDNE